MKIHMAPKICILAYFAIRQWEKIQLSFSMQIIAVLYLGIHGKKRQKINFNKCFKVFLKYFDLSEKPNPISGIGSEITQ